MYKLKLWHLLAAVLLAMLIYYNRPSYIERSNWKSLSVFEGAFLGDFFFSGDFTIKWPKIYYNGPKGKKEAYIIFCFCSKLYIYMPEEENKIGTYYRI